MITEQEINKIQEYSKKLSEENNLKARKKAALKELKKQQAIAYKYTFLGRLEESIKEMIKGKKYE